MNSLVTKPITVDTDLTTYTGAAAVRALGGVQGVRVQKLSLVVGTGGSSSAGTVTITGSDGIALYPPLAVAASIGARAVLFSDNPTAPNSSLTWKDFAVTGVTATGTVLYLWTTV